MIDKTATIVAIDFLHDTDLNELVLRLNDHIRDGWQPFNSIRYLDPKFVQAIVKYDTQPTAHY